MSYPPKFSSISRRNWANASVSSRTTTLRARKQQSRRWTVSRSARSDLRFNWNDPRTLRSRTSWHHPRAFVAGGLWRCDRVLSIGVAVPCQSQSVNRSVGRSIDRLRSSTKSVSQSVTTPWSVSRSVSLCLSVYEKKKTPKRKHTKTKKKYATPVPSFSLRLTGHRRVQQILQILHS